ncbi:MAG: 4'-phosphopantetheinyl transferase superfamily protein, partial [Bacteroidota bacterium]
DHRAPIGVDIQLPAKKLQDVREKFLSENEVKDSGNDMETLCIYWCAKEAIYKAHGGKGVSLKEDIHIQEFEKNDQGIVRGVLRNKPFVVHYSFYDHHVLTWSREA